MSDPYGTRLSSLDRQHIVADHHAFITFLDRQGTATALPEAGVPIQAGELYCDMHMYSPGGQPIKQALASGLAVTARSLQYNLELRRRNEAALPRQVVGVTHWGLARLAVYAGFQCVEVHPDLFNTPENQAVGWPEHIRRLRAKYESRVDLARVERGHERKEMRIGVVWQPIDTLISRWAGHTPYSAPEALGRLATHTARPLAGSEAKARLLVRQPR